jgi:alanine racemase
VRGVMSHFPCADETNKTLSLHQIEKFQHIRETTGEFGIEVYHMANSAGVLDLPGSYFDSVRPGIAIYGLPPSQEIVNHRVNELRPVLEWKTQITFLKEVPAATGLSYGHAFHTRQPSLIATVPVGYGDGLNRNLSNNMEMLVQGVRCPQVGRITMDQSLLDVTQLRGKVKQGDEVVIIGVQDKAMITADDLATKLGTINYEVVTGIAQRVNRIAVESK